MSFISFAAVVPEIGTSENRSLQVFENSEVPSGSYAFLECYCIEPECDCQLVRFVVIGQDGQEHANISYGWKDKAFYDKEFLDCEHNFPGPDFAALTPQGPYAKYFLEYCKKFLISDQVYVERLKRHHDLFKQEARKRDLFQLIKSIPLEKKASLGRNDLCLCGSGRKYKKCCY